MWLCVVKFWALQLPLIIVWPRDEVSVRDETLTINFQKNLLPIEGPAKATMSSSFALESKIIRLDIFS